MAEVTILRNTVFGNARFASNGSSTTLFGGEF